MSRTLLDSAHAIAGQFAIHGELADLQPYHRGHIHDTFISSWRKDETVSRYLHQRLNDHVFTDIPALMHNIERVTQHLSEQSMMDGFQALKLVSTQESRSYVMHPSGSWRTYRFVENTDTFDLCESADQAHEAARAFGLFQARLIDLDAESLRETIPHFFSSPFRMVQFQDALDSDPKGRAKGVAKELGFVQERMPMATVIDERIEAGAFPTRVVHGDTKLNNVLFDRDTGKATCIVDLDTCMPAYSLYDFGDLVRFTAAMSAEDETDLAKVGTDIELYRALVDGYLEGAGSFLTREEIELMPFTARLVTFTIGVRFLTDYLAGDVYFKTERSEQNLDRARVQFRMVECMEEREEEMAYRR